MIGEILRQERNIELLREKKRYMSYESIEWLYKEKGEAMLKLQEEHIRDVIVMMLIKRLITYPEKSVKYG